jgi:hypothetical protein
MLPGSRHLLGAQVLSLYFYDPSLLLLSCQCGGIYIYILGLIGTSTSSKLFDFAAMSVTEPLLVNHMRDNVVIPSTYFLSLTKLLSQKVETKRSSFGSLK